MQTIGACMSVLIAKVTKLLEDEYKVTHFESKTDKRVRGWVDQFIIEAFIEAPGKVMLSSPLADLTLVEEYNEVTDTIALFENKIPEIIRNNLYIKENGWVVYVNWGLYDDTLDVQKELANFIDWVRKNA